jgi:putative transposase
MSSKKVLKPAIKRELVSYLTAQFAMIFARPAERYPRYGFNKLFHLLSRQGNTWVFTGFTVC